MEERRLMLIVNPHAGKMKPRAALFDIVDLYCQNGWAPTVYCTAARRDATRMVSEFGATYDRVVCCGGDGTLSEVINGMMMLSRRPPLGYIPAGTTNDLASTLGLPRDVLTAAAATLSEHMLACDIGAFNDTFFSYIASFGAFTSVSYNTPQPIKNLLGHLAYMLEGVKYLSDIKPYHLAMEWDGRRLEDDFVFGAVSNTTSIAGLFRLSPDEVRLDDGLFEVLLVKMPQNLLSLHNIITALLRQNYDEEHILFFKARDLRIETQCQFDWSLDGEHQPASPEVEIFNHQQAIRFVGVQPLEATLPVNRQLST